jgi:dipeptidyl aminopeptidase/acylaminoacyl peptidase
MPQTPFSDLDAYLALPRTSGLAVSPDGTRLVTTLATLDEDAVRWVTSLWEVDPTGERQAVRLTRSRKGEASPEFLPDGSLLFTSARPDPDAKETPDDAPAALWVLPAGGGEARVAGTRGGGVGGPVVAGQSGTVLVSSATLPGAAAGRTTRRAARHARTRRSAPSSTRATPCASGITTSARTRRGC